MPTIACRISASNQDCLVYKDILGNWQLKLDSDDVAIGWQGLTRQASGSGLYFPNVPIPPGSKINQAFLIFRSSELRMCPLTKSLIQVEENATPIPFSTLANYQARSRWIVLQWWDFEYKDWKKDELYASPEIGKFVQKVIDLPAWAEGNPIVFFWDDHDDRSGHVSPCDREAYSYDLKPEEAPRLEITFTPPGAPPPPPPPPLPPPPPPPRKGWAGLDLQYEYLDDGFKLTFHTDVPCHLFCRMTTTPPRRHSLPSMRRGLRITGDIRFCFVVYEDNEQQEPGDTLIHTFVKDAWPVCERRWFYFIGFVYGDTSPSESPIFEFHFPAPPPAPPPPIEKIIFAQTDNRSIRYSHGVWAICHGSATGTVLPFHNAPALQISIETTLTISYWIIRAYLRFITSVLPSTANILSADLMLYIKSRLNGLPALQDFLCATEGIQQLPPIPTDYGAQLPYTTILGQIPIAGLTVGAYNALPLNADGMDLINPAGETKLCLRHYMDIIDTAPGLSSNYAVFRSVQMGAEFMPYLHITYYPA